jgi:hypothetical protein
MVTLTIRRVDETVYPKDFSALFLKGLWKTTQRLRRDFCRMMKEFQKNPEIVFEGELKGNS